MNRSGLPVSKSTFATLCTACRWEPPSGDEQGEAVSEVTLDSETVER